MDKVAEQAVIQWIPVTRLIFQLFPKLKKAISGTHF